MLVGHVAVREPFPWRHLLDYFAHRLIPQFERIENDCYVRQVGTRTIAVAYDPATAQLQVTSNGRVKASDVLHNVGRLLGRELRRAAHPQAPAALAGAEAPHRERAGHAAPRRVVAVRAVCAHHPRPASDGRRRRHADAPAG